MNDAAPQVTQTPPVAESSGGGEHANLSDHISVVMTQDFTEYIGDDGPKIRFLRVEINQIAPAVQSIIEIIANTSWVSDLVDDAIKQSFLDCAGPTIAKLSDDLSNAIDNDATKDVGEYVVSVVARTVIQDVYNYKALPLAEIIKEKVSGNPGFDYHHEKNGLILIFGEAKYKTGVNAYGAAFNQIVSHISKKKDMKEVYTLNYFLSEGAKENAALGKKGYSAAFSTAGRSVDSSSLISRIKRNASFNKLVGHEEVLIVAVDVSG